MGCRIVTNSEKVCAGTYQFAGDPQTVVSRLRREAGPDTVRIVARKGSQFERLKGSADVVEVYPNKEVVSISPYRLKGEPGRFVVRYRVTRPLSFLEQLPLRLFKVVI